MINLSRTAGFSVHRSGWNYCLNSLRPYHSNTGILFNDFIERTFSWDLKDYESNLIPYKFDWVGVLHNPPNHPDWFDTFHSPRAILSRDIFQESLRYCKCIITLSEYLAVWLREQIDVPVFSVLHPTEVPEITWSPYKFMMENKKQIVQVGYWLRVLDAIRDIEVPFNFLKFWAPSNRTNAEFLLSVREKHDTLSQYEAFELWKSVKILDFMTNDEYDEMYSKSVVFLNLYDSSANNAVIECVARNTPLIVNKLPAVVEYLGEDYPLYYKDYDEVYDILSTMDRIFDGHEYLKRMNKDWLEGSNFAINIVNNIRSFI